MLEKYSLTVEEWFIVKLLILASVDESHKEYLIRYLKLPNVNNFREILVSLQNKSVILKSYDIPKKGESFDPEDVELNKNFLKSFYKCSGMLGQELFNEYPYSMESGGRTFILNNITKGYNSLEDLYYDYGRIIQFNPATHNKVMSLLKFAKEHNLISYGLVEFIKSRKWLTIEKMKEDGSYIGMTLDNITAV